MLKKHLIRLTGIRTVTFSLCDEYSFFYLENMIGYKKSIPESLSEVKVGRGSGLYGRMDGQIVEHLKNNVSQLQIAKTLGILLWFIISMKHSENPEKSLNARENAGNQYWMSVFFRWFYNKNWLGWAQEQLAKPAASEHCIIHCHLHNAKKKNI